MTLQELDAILTARINRSAEVEQMMLDAANGKRPMPTPDELRAWALRLGTPEPIDANVMSVMTRHRTRAEKGLKKYGVTTERSDLSMLDWLRHLQEELMDGAVYAERLISTLPSVQKGAGK